MRRLSFLSTLAAILCLATFSVQAQNVDKILARYYEKTGGLDNWKKFKTMKTTVKVIQQAMEFPGVLLQKRPDKQRIDIDFQGQKFIQAYNGKEGWMLNPFLQMTEPKKMTEEELTELEDQIAVDEPFIDYRKKGHKVELEGTEPIEGTECYKVKLTKKNGNSHYYFFDKENSLLFMVRRNILAGPMKGQAGETYVSDYKPAGDLLLPHMVVNKFQGQVAVQIKVESYEVDPEIEDSVFDFPAK